MAVTAELRLFLPQLKKYLGIYVRRESYLGLCSFLDGYEAAAGTFVMKEFHEWLGDRRGDRKELDWALLVLLEIYDYPPPQLRELSREQEAEANARLLELLEEFFEERSRASSSGAP